jgi:hypothetical protein
VRLFVAPLYVWLPPAAGALLFAMAVARTLRLRGDRGGCGCEVDHGPEPKAQLTYALVLLIPIIAAVSVDPRQFSSDGLRKRLGLGEIGCYGLGRKLRQQIQAGGGLQFAHGRKTITGKV